MAKKPVTPGASHAAKGKGQKPSFAEKAATRGLLIAKGVAAQQAAFIAGVGEDLTREEIAERRIAWQKNLPKA